MNKNTTWVWVGVAVVVVGLLVWVFSAVGGSSAPAPAPGPSAPSGPLPAYAPAGQAVQGFPKELILGGSPDITNSYSLNYSADANQYTAQWTSTSSPVALYNKYITYFGANNWTVTNHINSKPTFQSIYARNSAADVNVVVSTQGKVSQVVVTYAMHTK